MRLGTLSAWWILFFLWVVLFFPQWYVLSYTKVRELQSMIGRSRERQMQVLHPGGEMLGLIQLKAYLQTKFSPHEVVIQIPQSNVELPLANNAPIMRAVLYPYALGESDPNKTTIIVYRAGESCTENERTVCWSISLP